MECGSASMLFVLVIACAAVGEASILKEKYGISPRLSPESSKEFFTKDYPNDKRPKADGLHFKHPYPVVQDSQDFDKDFIKDENTDNGEWRAQSEYDRLRSKLRTLKRRAAEALEKKNQENTELNEAMKKYQEEMVKEKADIAKESNEVVKPHEPVTVKPVPEKPTSPPTTLAPTQAPKKLDTEGAAEAVDKSIKSLKGCQSQLAEARAELEKEMDKLKEAKVKQVKARELVNQATIKQIEADKEESTLNKQYTEEATEHAAVESAYMKQKATVDRLHEEVRDAAAKVKAIRDAEDRDGGVYPTPTKSIATAISYSQMLVFICAVTAIARSA